jgi:O-methyltransferase
MVIEASYKQQLLDRFNQPHFRVLRLLRLFDTARSVNRWLYRIKCQQRALRGQGLVPEARLREVYVDALRRLQALDPDRPLGDYLEFGVAFGSAMACMHEALRIDGTQEMRLFGFDSFEGLPDEADEEPDHGWFAGQIQSLLSFAKKLLTRRGVEWDRTFLIKGWFKDTLTDGLRAEHDLHHASIIMIDSDLYSSACEVLAFCEPLIGRHAIMLFDEWNAYGLADQNSGEKRAFDEFLARHPHITAEPLPSYSKDSAVFLLTNSKA